MSLREKAGKATLWSAIEIFTRQGVQFLVAIVLARILEVDDFGVVALLAVFSGIANTVFDSGLTSALIREEKASAVDESTVFWFNISVASLCGIALGLLGEPISRFYSAPEISALAWVMALNVLVSAFGAVPRALLAKVLNFKDQVKIGLISVVGSGLVALSAALYGAGPWALVLQAVVGSAISSSLLWRVSRWRPIAAFSISSAKRMLRFGSYLLAASVLDVIYNNVYALLIGKSSGLRDVGFYNRADSIKQLPVGVLTSVISRVAFPVFSQVAGEPDRLRAGVRAAVRGLMLLNIPMMLGLSACSSQVVEILVGQKWLPSSPLLSILCLSGMLWPLQVINVNALISLGDSRAFFWLDVAKKVIGFVFLIIGAYFGAEGVAWSVVAFSIVAFAINATFCGRRISYGFQAQLRDVLPILSLGLAMYVLLKTVSKNTFLAPILEVGLLAAVGAIFYFGVGRMLRLSAIGEAAGLLVRVFDRSRFRRK